MTPYANQVIACGAPDPEIGNHWPFTFIITALYCPVEALGTVRATDGRQASRFLPVDMRAVIQLIWDDFI